MRDILTKLVLGIVFVNGLGELALSQIHILAITKIFANEIGFYLFFFIIFGLVTAFNLFLLESRRGMTFFAVSSWMAAGMGWIYLRLMQADVAAQTKLTMADVHNSRVLMMVSIGIYFVGSILVPALYWPKVKEAKLND